MVPGAEKVADAVIKGILKDPNKQPDEDTHRCLEGYQVLGARRVDLGPPPTPLLVCGCVHPLRSSLNPVLWEVLWSFIT